MSKAEQEVRDLHEFFVQWFAGSCPNEDTHYRDHLLPRLDPDFSYIQPGGQILSYDALRDGMRSAHGTNKNFRIAIRGFETRLVSQDLLVVTYEEWQRNAIHSEPADNGRLSTAIFKRSSSAPNALSWLHIHETWLPPERMRAGPFDF